MRKVEPADVSRRKPFVARWLEHQGVHTTPKVDRMISWAQIVIIATSIVVIGKWLSPLSPVVLRPAGTGSSMDPTIQYGDIFLVEKVSWKLGLRPLQPGDIISFEFKDGRVAKRLIAVGGQRVSIKDCYVYVDDQPVRSEKFNHPEHPDPQRQCYHNIGGWMAHPGVHVLVPKGHYFVLGDNSMHSFDSRFEVFGFVKHESVNGRYLLRIWPPWRWGVP